LLGGILFLRADVAEIRSEKSHKSIKITISHSFDDESLIVREEKE
jgi:hypothetical protein